MNRKHCISTLFILFAISIQPLFAQEKTITGTVVAQGTGQPLYGVNIINGKGYGTYTSEKGTYKIIASLGDSLSFSYVGYKTVKYSITDASSILNIQLTANDNSLNEVVVTALGINRARKSLGYAIQEVKSDELSTAKSTNLTNELAGKIAGVRITNSQGNMGSSRIVIRGETSIDGNNQPLFIIDGIPIDNSQLGAGSNGRDFANAISDINSEDIESLSVLKGPTAAALYGSRAAHGVIIIKTKSGHKKNGLGITINSNNVFDKVLILPDYQNVFGQGANGKFSYIDGKGGGVNDGVDESWGPKMDGRLIPQFGSNGVAVPFVPHPDNIRSFFKTGFTSDNGISIADAGDKYNYRVSFNNTHLTGITPNTVLNKRNLSFNTTFVIAPKLTLTTVGNYYITDAPNLPGAGGKRATSTMLQFIWNGRQVDFNKLKESYFATGSPLNWNNAYYPNPYFAAYQNTVQQRRDRLVGDVALKYEFTKELSARFHSGVDYYNDRRKLRVAYGTSGTPYGSYEEDAYSFNENNTELTLTYNKNINSDFTLNVVAGGNIRNNNYEENDQQAPRLAVPDVYTLNNSRDPLVSSNILTNSRVYSLYSSAQVGYRNYAFINVTARNDWSSTLPPQNQSYFYPSVSGSLIFSDLLKIKGDVLSYGKLRAGWAKVGSDAPPYSIVDYYNFAQPFNGNPQLIPASVKNNPDLKSESTISTEIGTDLGFFKNRLRLDVSLYNTNSYNQILKVDVPPATGYKKQVLNAGKINNKGVEIQLSGTPVKSENFSWDVSVNFAANRSKVVYLDDKGQRQTYLLGSDRNVQVVASVGQAYGTLMGITYQRDAKGNVLIDGTGIPLYTSSVQSFGSFQPKWIGGINNSFAYKNFSFSFLIDASVGGKLYSNTNSTGDYTGVLAQTLRGRDAAHGGLSYYYADNKTSGLAIPISNGNAPAGAVLYDDGMIFKGIGPDGNTNQQIVTASQYYKAQRNNDAAYIYNSTYIKFREVKFGYAFNKKLLQKIGFQGAVISIVGRNLFFIHKEVPNIDPETAFNTGNAQGLEDLTYPTTRSFGINLNLKF